MRVGAETYLVFAFLMRSRYWLGSEIFPPPISAPHGLCRRCNFLKSTAQVIGFAPERDFRRRLSDAGAPIRNEWQFADKVLEKVDAEIHFDFASDDHAGDSKIIPMEDAPCVFGETSLWYSTNIENGFSARSVNYTELLRIPTSTLTSLAKQDPRVKTRQN